MKYLGLDLGSRTLGISISDVDGRIATSYQVIKHQEEYPTPNQQRQICYCRKM